MLCKWCSYVKKDHKHKYFVEHCTWASMAMDDVYMHMPSKAGPDGVAVCGCQHIYRIDTLDEC